MIEGWIGDWAVWKNGRREEVFPIIENEKFKNKVNSLVEQIYVSCHRLGRMSIRQKFSFEQSQDGIVPFKKNKINTQLNELMDKKDVHSVKVQF